MMPEETDEQFEERMRNKRTNVLLRLMANQLDEDGFISFTNLVKSNRRKQVRLCPQLCYSYRSFATNRSCPFFLHTQQVAQKFYSLLVLKKQQAIELYQDESTPYGDLTINKGSRYEDALVASTV